MGLTVPMERKVQLDQKAMLVSLASKVRRVTSALLGLLAWLEPKDRRDFKA